MRTASIAWKNVTRSFGKHALYLASIACNVFAYYLFAAARTDPAVTGVVGPNAGFVAGMVVASVVIAIFAAVFMWYSSSFFLRFRAREIGLYGLFGVSRARISATFFTENMLAGTLALALGIGVGIPFSKLFMMAILRILGLDGRVSLSVSGGAVTETLIVFAALLAVSSLAAARRAYRFRLADTFRAERSAERRPRRSLALGAASVLVLVVGYTLAALTTADTLIVNFLVVSFLTIVGTWAFARGGGGLVLTLMGKSPRVRASGPRLISMGTLGFRIGSNARVFFIIAIVSAGAMIALGVGLNMKYMMVGELEQSASCTLSYLERETRTDAPAILEKAGARVTSRVEARIVRGSWHNNASASDFTANRAVRLMPDRDYLACLSGRDLREALTALAALGPGQAACVEPNSLRAERVMGKLMRVSFGKEAGTASLAIVARLTAPGIMLPDAESTFVVTEADFQALAAAHPAAARRLVGISLADERNADAAVQALKTALGKTAELVSRTDFREIMRYMDLVLFIGILIGLVFLVSCCSILHFKQLMDAADDARRNEVLFKIGMSERDARSVVRLQVLPVYALPLGLASLHGAVALSVMGRVLETDFTLPIVCVILCFGAVFLAFGGLTTRSCMRLMRRAMPR
jgi:putative ABC transport system permease protein